MMKKKWLILALLTVAALAMTGCAQQQQPAADAQATAAQTAEASVEPAAAAEETKAEELELTLEELKGYNGKDGARAYVAVDGVIYDVTDSAAWKNGAHNGFEAGQDLTEAIKSKSPHGVAKLGNVPVVGKLKAE